MTPQDFVIWSGVIFFVLLITILVLTDPEFQRVMRELRAISLKAAKEPTKEQAQKVMKEAYKIKVADADLLTKKSIIRISILSTLGLIVWIVFVTAVISIYF